MRRNAAGLSRLLILLALPASVLLACESPRPQVLIRGTPQATPTTARVIQPTATTTSTPLPTSPPTLVPTATPVPTASPTAVPPTATPTRPPTATPTVKPPPPATATPVLVRIHAVKAGETLAIIAGRYGSSITAIMRANGLTNANRIYVGQRLIIP